MCAVCVGVVWYVLVRVVVWLSCCGCCGVVVVAVAGCVVFFHVCFEWWIVIFAKLVVSVLSCAVKNIYL